MKNFISLCIFASTVALSMMLAQAADDTAYDTARQQIQTLISSTYDQPGAKVETVPIVIADDYAIADWIQGKKGGRALLRHAQGQWQIMACGGDGFKEMRLLQDAGIPAKTAKNLITRLRQAEQSVSAERVKRFDLFDRSKDPRLADHHAPTTP